MDGSVFACEIFLLLEKKKRIQSDRLYMHAHTCGGCWRKGIQSPVIESLSAILGSCTVAK